MEAKTLLTARGTDGAGERDCRRRFATPIRSSVRPSVKLRAAPLAHQPLMRARISAESFGDAVWLRRSMAAMVRCPTAWLGDELNEINRPRTMSIIPPS